MLEALKAVLVCLLVTIGFTAASIAVLFGWVILASKVCKWVLGL